MLRMSNMLERIDERTERFDRWAEDHEAEDAKTRERIGSLEKFATLLAIAWGVLVVVVPGAWWLFGVLQGSAKAQ